MIVASILACLATVGPVGYSLVSLVSAGGGLAKLNQEADIAGKMPTIGIISSVCTVIITMGTLLLLAAL